MRCLSGYGDFLGKGEEPAAPVGMDTAILGHALSNG